MHNTEQYYERRQNFCSNFSILLCYQKLEKYTTSTEKPEQFHHPLYFQASHKANAVRDSRLGMPRSYIAMTPATADSYRSSWACLAAATISKALCHNREVSTKIRSCYL